MEGREIQPSPEVRMPAENREVFESVGRSLAVGVQRDKIYSQLIEIAENEPTSLPESWRFNTQFLFFEDTSGLAKLIGEENEMYGQRILLNPQLGLVTEGQFFTSRRDGWERTLGAPKVAGVRTKEGFQIEIKPNHIYGISFSSEVIPGISGIALRGDGQIVKMQPPRIELTSEEKIKLAKVFKMVETKAKQILEMNRKTLENYSSRSEIPK